MNLSDFSAYKQAEKFVRNIVKTSKQLNNLETGALVATTAGLIGLALIVHIIFTVFALMSGGLLLYRYLAFKEQQRDIAKLGNLQTYDDVLERKKELWASQLPDDEKRRLSEHLDFLYLDSIRNKQLTTEKPKRKKLNP